MGRVYEGFGCQGSGARAYGVQDLGGARLVFGLRLWRLGSNRDREELLVTAEDACSA